MISPPPFPFPRGRGGRKGCGGGIPSRPKQKKPTPALFFRKEQDAESKIFFSLKELKKMALANLPAGRQETKNVKKILLEA